MGDVLQMAFTAEQVRALTSLSQHQLAYWVSTGFVVPELVTHDDATRLFTFRELVGLRVIGMLRNEHMIPLQELRKVGEWLKRYHSSPWASLRFYVANKTVYFDDPATDARVRARAPEQVHFKEVALQRVADDTSELVQAMRRRRSEQLGRIERKRDVARNAPRLAGTRIPTAAIWSFHEAKYTTAQILAEYPSLSEADVESAIAFERDERRKRARRRSA